MQIYATQSWCIARRIFHLSLLFSLGGVMMYHFFFFLHFTSLSLSCWKQLWVSCIWKEYSAWISQLGTRSLRTPLCSRQSSASVFSAGQSVRSRRILHEAHEEGRPCPLQLTQTKPCPIRPCYTWLLSDWSPCTVEVGRARHTNVMGVSGIFLVTLIVRNINDPESTAS